MRRATIWKGSQPQKHQKPGSLIIPAIVCAMCLPRRHVRRPKHWFCWGVCELVAADFKWFARDDLASGDAQIFPMANPPRVQHYIFCEHDESNCSMLTIVNQNAATAKPLDTSENVQSQRIYCNMNSQRGKSETCKSTWLNTFTGSIFIYIYMLYTEYGKVLLWNYSCKLILRSFLQNSHSEKIVVFINLGLPGVYRPICPHVGARRQQP
jgi:hypothetical protein